MAMKARQAQNLAGVSDLPRELVETIFRQFIDDSTSLSICSMVCSDWSFIARRMLFRHIHLNYDTSTTRRTRRRSPQKPHPIWPRAWVPDFEGFWSMVNVNDKVASYVQVLEITGMSPLSSSSLLKAPDYCAEVLPPWDTLNPGLLSDILCILPSLTQLTIRQVVLQGLDFASPYHDVLPMPRLDALRLENVGLSDDRLISCMLSALVPKNLYIDAFHAHLDTSKLVPHITQLRYADSEIGESEHLLDIGPALRAIRTQSLPLQSLKLSIESVAQLNDLVKLIVTCHRLQELSLDLSGSAEHALCGRTEYVQELWQSLNLSKCVMLAHFKVKANIGANINPPSAMKRMFRLISLLPPSVERLTLELCCDNYVLALQRAEMFHDLHHAVLPKSSHIGEMFILLLERVQQLDDEEILRKEELISTFTDIVPTGIIVKVQVVSEPETERRVTV